MGLMNEVQARQAIVDAGTVLYKQGYVVSNDGNISVRISPDTIVVTPYGVSEKGDGEPDMMVGRTLTATSSRKAFVARRAR